MGRRHLTLELHAEAFCSLFFLDKTGKTYNYEFVFYDRAFETFVTVLAQNVPIRAFEISSYKVGRKARIYIRLILSNQNI